MEPESEDPPLLVVENLSAERSSRAGEAAVALRGVSLEIAAGEVFVLGGESGSGKSLLVRLILGAPDPGVRIMGGSVRFEGEELLAKPDRERRAVRRHRMAFVGRAAEDVFNPERRVVDSLREFARFQRGKASRDERDWNDEFYSVGIIEPERVLAKRIGELPLLVVQKLALMRGLLSGARLFVCDESVSGLDRVAQNEFLDLVCQLRDGRGLSFVMAMGKLRGVDRYADRLAVFFDGGILEQGTAADIVRSPSYFYTKEFVACAPKLTDRPRAIAGVGRDAVREAEETIHGASSPLGGGADDGEESMG